MSHDCIERINEKLLEHNAVIRQPISLSDPTRELIPVEVQKADSGSRKKPPALYATFCPFCGEKLGGAE